MHRLDSFSPTHFDRGATFVTEVLWIICKNIFFLSAWPWPSFLKVFFLRLFGAKVGKSVCIRSRVNIHFPWKLFIGDNCWIGERCELLNLESITLLDNVALAHDVYLAAASHDIKSKSMAYRNRPILIKSGSWIATRAFVGAGVTIGSNCVIGACSVIMNDLPDDKVVIVRQSFDIRQRILDRA